MTLLKLMTGLVFGIASIATAQATTILPVILTASDVDSKLNPIGNVSQRVDLQTLDPKSIPNFIRLALHNVMIKGQLRIDFVSGSQKSSLLVSPQNLVPLPPWDSNGWHKNSHTGEIEIVGRLVVGDVKIPIAVTNGALSVTFNLVKISPDINSLRVPKIQLLDTGKRLIALSTQFGIYAPQSELAPSKDPKVIEIGRQVWNGENVELLKNPMDRTPVAKGVSCKECHGGEYSVGFDLLYHGLSNQEIVARARFHLPGANPAEKYDSQNKALALVSFLRAKQAEIKIYPYGRMWQPIALPSASATQRGPSGILAGGGFAYAITEAQELNQFKGIFNQAMDPSARLDKVDLKSLPSSRAAIFISDFWPKRPPLSQAAVSETARTTLFKAESNLRSQIALALKNAGTSSNVKSQTAAAALAIYNDTLHKQIETPVLSAYKNPDGSLLDGTCTGFESSSECMEYRMSKNRSLILTALDATYSMTASGKYGVGSDGHTHSNFGWLNAGNVAPFNNIAAALFSFGSPARGGMIRDFAVGTGGVGTLIHTSSAEWEFTRIPGVSYKNSLHSVAWDDTVTNLLSTHQNLYGESILNIENFEFGYRLTTLQNAQMDGVNVLGDILRTVIFIDQSSRGASDGQFVTVHMRTVFLDYLAKLSRFYGRDSGPTPAIDAVTEANIAETMIHYGISNLNSLPDKDLIAFSKDRSTYLDEKYWKPSASNRVNCMGYVWELSRNQKTDALMPAYLQCVLATLRTYNLGIAPNTLAAKFLSRYEGLTGISGSAMLNR